MRFVLPAFSVLLMCALGGASCRMASEAQPKPWKFAVFSDVRAGRVGQPGTKNGVNVLVARAIAEDIAKQHVDLVIFPGDLINGSDKFGPLAGQYAAWKEAMQPLSDAGIPVYVCRGNHELGQDSPQGSALAAWRAAFPDLPRNGPPGHEGLTYSLDHRNARFVAFDQYLDRSPTYDRKKYDSRLNSGVVPPWVLEQVKAGAGRWVFAFGHEAAFVANHADCLANAPEERDALWEALGATGGVYFCGHDHFYTRLIAPDRHHRPVLELIVGDGGAPPYAYPAADAAAQPDPGIPLKPLFVNARPDHLPNTGNHPMYFGYVVLTVDGDQLAGEWRAFLNCNALTSEGPVPPELPKFAGLDQFSIARSIAPAGHEKP